jgi:hypothetical protein
LYIKIGLGDKKNWNKTDVLPGSGTRKSFK